MVDHVFVKFGDSSCIGFWVIVWKSKPTNQPANTTPLGTLPTQLLSACVTKH